MKKKSKSKISVVKRKAWQAFSAFIKKRDDYKCFTCDRVAKGPGMHAGHYIPKSLSQNLLFDEHNVHAQCYRCNVHLSGNADEYSIRLEKKYGKEILKELRRKKKETKQWTIEELEDLRDKYS